MKIKLIPSDCRQVTSKTSGKQFYVANAELPDDGGEWKTCRWTIMSEKPIPPASAEFVVTEYKSMEGAGRARPL